MQFELKLLLRIETRALASAKKEGEVIIFGSCRASLSFALCAQNGFRDKGG